MRIKRFISSKVIGYSKDRITTHYQHEIELWDGSVNFFYSSDKQGGVTAYHKLSKTKPKVDILPELETA